MFHSLVWLVTIALVASACASGTPRSASLPPEGPLTEDHASRLVRQMADELRTRALLPGLSIAISRNGQVILAEGFGYADIDARSPVTPETRFRTASVAKVITATAVGRLWQEGRLRLDVPVQEYVPSFPLKAWPITTRQLAGHLSGIPHYSDADSLEQRFYPSVLDALNVFAHADLVAEPKTRYHYSTHGYTLLSAVIEGASEQSFLEYLQQAVFEPLAMRSTGPDLRARPPAELATLYAWRDGELVRIPQPEDPSYKWAGGGLISTPTDLVRLADGYFNGYLDSATVSLMWTSQRLESGRETGVGFGWRNGRDIDGRRVLEHAGSMEGARTVVSIFPEEKLVVALMTNREWSSTIEETVHMLALPFLTTTSPLQELRGTFAVTVEVVSVSGNKEVRPGTLILADEHARLVIDPGSGDEQSFSLFHLSADVYALVRPDGIYHTTIRVVDGVVAGQVTGYGSPQLTSPAGNPPFMTFFGAIQ